MVRLVTSQPSRLFAFGCSFTKYNWTTWPEIIAHDIGIEEFYNLGLPGAGNELMFNRFMQADSIYGFGPEDLVMVCWTNVCREDRFANGGWICPGNIYSQTEYPESFVERYYADPLSPALHDFAFIRAVRLLLQHSGCQWHFMQMLDLADFPDQWQSDVSSVSSMLTTELPFMLPSFYNVLWQNDIEARHELERQRYGSFDGHPSPAEHHLYLSTVFNHAWTQATLESVDRLEQQYQANRRDGKNSFDHLVASRHVPDVY